MGGYRRPYDDRRDRDPPPQRSHAAIPIALVIVVVGLYAARYSILIPLFLGLLLVGVALTFLSSRLNPLSISFYLTTKPSWSAIGVLALGGFGLLAAAYEFYVRVHYPLVP